MKTPLSSLIDNQGEILDLDQRSFPGRPLRDTECVYCHRKFNPREEEYPFVARYGWCVRCEDIQRDYENDDRVYIVPALEDIDG